MSCFHPVIMAISTIAVMGKCFIEMLLLFFNKEMLLMFFLIKKCFKKKRFHF